MSRKLRFSMRTLLIGMIILSISFGVGMFAWKRIVYRHYYSGVTAAYKDWREGSAVRYVNPTNWRTAGTGLNRVEIKSNYYFERIQIDESRLDEQYGGYAIFRPRIDRETGILIGYRDENANQSMLEFYQGYEATIDSLFNRHGSPNQKYQDYMRDQEVPSQIPTNAQRVDEFPFNVNDEIVLHNKGIFVSEAEIVEFDLEPAEIDFYVWTCDRNPEIVQVALTAQLLDHGFYVIGCYIFHESGEFLGQVHTTILTRAPLFDLTKPSSVSN